MNLGLQRSVVVEAIALERARILRTLIVVISALEIGELANRSSNGSKIQQ